MHKTSLAEKQHGNLNFQGSQSRLSKCEETRELQAQLICKPTHINAHTNSSLQSSTASNVADSTQYKKNYILDFYFNMHYFSVLYSNSEVGTSSSPYMSTEQENH